MTAERVPSIPFFMTLAWLLFARLTPRFSSKPESRDKGKENRCVFVGCSVLSAWHAGQPSLMLESLIMQQQFDAIRGILKQAPSLCSDHLLRHYAR